MSHIAVDIGGTKVDVGVFNEDGALLRHERFATHDYASIVEVLHAAQILQSRPREIGVAIAGPVLSRRETLTNLSWMIDADEIEAVFKTPVSLMNDMEAHAYGAAYSHPSERKCIQTGVARPEGNAAVIAPGTGLGEAILFRHNGRYYANACEGSHASFAPNTDTEVALLQFARREHHHVSSERLISGSLGLPMLVAFQMERLDLNESQRDMLKSLALDPSLGARVGALAAEGEPICVEIMQMLARMLASEAANLTLKALALGGVFICGAMAEKMLPWLTSQVFAEGFHNKGRFRKLMEQVPVWIIVNEWNALYGIYAKSKLVNS